MRNSYDNVIIPDVRFENEAAICDFLIGIYRDVPSVNAHSSEEFAERLIDEADSSEHGLVTVGNRKVDYLIVYNTQDIDDLERKL